LRIGVFFIILIFKNLNHGVVEMSLRKKLAEAVDNAVQELLRSAGVSAAGAQVVVEPTVRREHGDFATNAAMQLASVLRRPPLSIAEEICAKLEVPRWVKQVEIARPGFINFFVDWGAWWQEGGEGEELAEKREKVVVEHTSINPNKAAHIGHLRNACLGDSLVRLLRRVGHGVEVHNYIDDLGNQVADTVVGMLDVEHEGHYVRFSDYCWDLYAKVNRAYKQGDVPESRRAEVLTALEEGTGNIAWLGALVAERNVRDHLEDMAEFGIRYDLLVWESDIVREGFWDAAFQRLRESPLFVREEEGPLAGCWVLRSPRGDEEDAEASRADKVLVRSNGVLTYTAKDIAYHLWKFGLIGKDFSYRRFQDGLWSTGRSGEPGSFGRADRVINVIDVRQEYPQAMVKLALRTLGFEREAENLVHLGYGVVSLSPDTAHRLGMDVSEGRSSYAMSGRQGIGVKVGELLDRMEETVERVRPRKEGLSSREIAAAAIRYHLLKVHATTELVFDLEQAADLHGNSGVYLMYQHARAAKILRDGSGTAKADPAPEGFADLAVEEEVLLRQLAEWPETLEKAARDLNVAAICHYAYELAAAFSKFYTALPILKSEEPKRSFRLWLVSRIREVLADAFSVIGIPAPERM
jgi:arginyl-tRNA synthetase